MKTAAIICEYNPFHKGHQYHIELTKKLTGCDALLCIMSGSFMQRGIPSIMDKWSRAETAVLSGADLVLELPVVYSTASAEFFAKGAIAMLDALSVVDFVSFGSESGNVELIKTIGKLLSIEPQSYKAELKNQLGKGLPFAKAREEAVKSYLSLESNIIWEHNELESLLSSSNNILAIEYCKALYNNKSSIEPITLIRQGEDYNSTKIGSSFISATAIREKLKLGELNELEAYLPKPTYSKLLELKEKGAGYVFEEHMFPYLKYKLMLNRNLDKLPDVSEGLDNSIYKSMNNAESFQQLIMGAKSKRYTYTRLSRILCQYYIGLESFPLSLLRSSFPSYARVLAFNDTGRSLLKLVKDNSSIDIITKMPKEANAMLEADLLSTAAYSIISPSISSKEDYVKGPKYIKQ